MEAPRAVVLGAAAARGLGRARTIRCSVSWHLVPKVAVTRLCAGRCGTTGSPSTLATMADGVCGEREEALVVVPLSLVSGGLVEKEKRYYLR